MTSEQDLSDKKPTRYQRYRAVIDCTLSKPHFDISEIKAECTEKVPAFVTRVINELEESGWLVREDNESSNFRWNTGRGTFPVTQWLDDKLFGTQIKESPEQERPRERLLSVGVENLTESELIAILIRSGRPGESAVTGGEKIAKAFQGHLERLPTAGRAELKEITSTVEKTAYCQIMAGIELGRRIAETTGSVKPTKISGSSDAIQFCKMRFHRLAAQSKQEEFHIVTLDTKNCVIDTHRITVGTLDASLVHPREVFRAAIKDSASSILLVHNHPSGDPTPSREDFSVTERLTECGRTLGIDVLDHIVLGNPDAISIREQ